MKWIYAACDKNTKYQFIRDGKKKIECFELTKYINETNSELTEKKKLKPIITTTPDGPNKKTKWKNRYEFFFRLNIFLSSSSSSSAINSKKKKNTSFFSQQNRIFTVCEKIFIRSVKEAFFRSYNFFFLTRGPSPSTTQFSIYIIKKKWREKRVGEIEKHDFSKYHKAKQKTTTSKRYHHIFIYFITCLLHFSSYSIFTSPPTLASPLCVIFGLHTHTLLCYVYFHSHFVDMFSSESKPVKEKRKTSFSLFPLTFEL